LIGFCGLYFVLGILYLFMIGRAVAKGPGHMVSIAHVGGAA
jgi:hypothetical protein